MWMLILACTLGNLTDLRYLILDHNELSFLPETIGTSLVNKIDKFYYFKSIFTEYS